MKKKGLFSRDQFSYDVKQDHYTCPNGKILTLSRVKKGSKIITQKIKAKTKTSYRYKSEASDCASCKFKSRCLDSKTKTANKSPAFPQSNQTS